MRDLLTEERLSLYPRAILLALGIAFALVLLSADGARTIGGRLGGDYAAFYAAGRLLIEGDITSLYDVRAQARIQQALFPGEEGAFLYFAYPPFVALPFALLASCGFVAGYALYTLILVCALWLSVRAARPLLPWCSASPLALFVMWLSFYPLFRAIFGGQNTPLSLLVLSVCARLLHDGGVAREIGAGAVAALLLAKPQLGVPLLGLLGLRHPRALLGALPVAAVLYAIGAAMLGPSWLSAWWEGARWLQQQSFGVDSANSIGFLGFFDALVGGSAGQAAGGSMLVAAAALLCFVWLAPSSHARRWALTAALLPLLPPHSLLYDAGIAALPLALLIEHTRRPTPAALAFSAALLGALAPQLGFNPLMPVTLAIGLAAARAVR